MDASVQRDARATISCATVAEANGWSLCAEAGERCELVFEDGAGCNAVCEALGRACVASYEDAPGECVAQADLPSLDCAETGHGSDYCVCGGAPPGSTDGGAGDGGALDASPDAWIDGTIAEGCAGEPPQLSCFGAWPGCCDEGPSPTTGECDPELARWSCPAGTFDHCDCGPPPDAGP